MNLNVTNYRAPPVLYSLVGSNDDGATWTIISRGTLGTGWSQGQTRQVLIEKPISAYTWFRFIAESSEPITGTDYVRVAEFIPVFEERNWTEKKIVQIGDNNELLASNEVVGDLDITGDLTVDGELNIGGEKIARGATNGLQLYGPSSDIGGPHIQAFVSTDDYPVFQQLNNSHGSIAMCFDAYADGFTWKSSSTSNAIIYKSNTDLEFSYSSGVAAGGVVTWNAGFSMDLANGLVSFSNGVDVTGNLTVSGTVDGVDLKALETAVSANTAKVSYTDATKVGLITVTQAVNLDTMETDIATNNNKVSASGSISTHSDVNLNLLKDYEVLTYFSGEWKNMTTQAPDTSAFLLANGTKAMTGNLNMGNQDIDNVNQIFVDRKSTSNNKIVLYDGGTPSTTAFYGFGIQSGTLLYNVDASTSNHKFYYGGTNELFRIGNAAVYSYRNLDVKGNIILSGTVDGVDVASLGDDVKYNTAYRNISHLPLSGGGITGDVSINGELNVGGAKIARGATSGLQLSGPSSNIAGPHIQAFTSADTYPVFQLLNWEHDNINLCFDAYYDDEAWKSSSSSPNVFINKNRDRLDFRYENGRNIGSTVYWKDGFSMHLTNGLVSCHNGLDVNGNITVSGTVDGYNLDTLNANINSKLPLSGGTVSGGTTFNSGVTFNQSITMNTNKQIFWRDATAERCGLKWLDDNHVFYCRRWANEMILDEWGRFNIRIAHYDKGWATGSGWFTSSDYNMKKNIRDISTCALDTINLLKPQCYILKDDGTENTTCGLIAQDVKKLVDEKKICFNPVNEINYEHDPDRENIMGLDYNSFIGLLIKGVQELSAEVKELKAEVELLKVV